MGELQFRDNQNVDIPWLAAVLEMQPYRFLNILKELVRSLPLRKNVLTDPASTPCIAIPIDFHLYGHEAHSYFCCSAVAQFTAEP